MSKRVLIVLHQEHSTPGRVGRLLVERGYELDIRRTPCGCCLPDALDGYAGIVVFGGPMSANDEDEWCIRQTRWIGQVLASGVPYLGLCLGAQMLARHLGAKVGPHPDGHAEIGYFSIAPTPEGEAFSREIGAPWPRQVYHWHREGFDLPPGAVSLAAGDTFPNQAFRYGRNAYGLQFHPEVTYAMMCRWTVRGHERLALPGARQRHEHLAGWFRNDPPVRRWLDAFLDHWLASGHAVEEHPASAARDMAPAAREPARLAALAG